MSARLQVLNYLKLQVFIWLTVHRFEIGYNVIKGTEYFCRYKRVSLKPRSIILWLTLRNYLVPQYI
jgi:hypothetical protein